MTEFSDRPDVIVDDGEQDPMPMTKKGTTKKVDKKGDRPRAGQLGFASVAYPPLLRVCPHRVTSQGQTEQGQTLRRVADFC